MSLSETVLGDRVVEMMVDSLEESEPKLSAAGRYRKALRLVETMSDDDIIFMVTRA
jgi:hypothetical protein